jgi:dTDP-4-dehydrorhamnose reductase
MIDESDSNSIRNAEQINGEFPHELATIAAPLGARIIQISTDAVYSETAGRCLETTSTGPTTVYGRTKLRGEVNHPAVLNIRTSMYGMDPAHGRGLFEWFRRQPAGARVPGFTDQLWAGCTTLQLARLCRALITGLFYAARAEGANHHFCPLGPMSNFELLSALNRGARVALEVVPTVSGRPSTRHLDTTLNLRYACQPTRLSRAA